MTTWNDPTLGSFDCGRFGWTRTIQLPAFKSFSYRKPWVTKPPGKPKFSILLPSFGPGRGKRTVPPQAEVRIARAVFESQARIAELVLATFWDEFNGRGAVSGLWWRGKLEQIRATVEASGLGPLEGPADLKRLLRLTDVAIAPFIDGSDEPVAQLCFVAAFEPEHGVGVLTDGQAILGTGYMMEVQPYPRPRRRRSGSSR
jgi:hypothetical protein